MFISTQNSRSELDDTFAFSVWTMTKDVILNRSPSIPALTKIGNVLVWNVMLSMRSTEDDPRSMRPLARADSEDLRISPLSNPSIHMHKQFLHLLKTLEDLMWQKSTSLHALCARD